VKRLVVSLAVLVLTLALASPAAARATSYTQTVHNVTEVLPPGPQSVIPCTGAPATITVTYNGVFHINSLPGGEFWMTFTQTGTFTAVPLDSTQPTLTGRFTIWGNFNLNERNQNSTFTFTVRASDGTVFHDTAHFSMNATGEITTSFVKPSCQCATCSCAGRTDSPPSALRVWCVGDLTRFDFERRCSGPRATHVGFSHVLTRLLSRVRPCFNI
jgi:hypothetical protein